MTADEIEALLVLSKTADVVSMLLTDKQMKLLVSNIYSDVRVKAWAKGGAKEYNRVLAKHVAIILQGEIT